MSRTIFDRLLERKQSTPRAVLMASAGTAAARIEVEATFSTPIRKPPVTERLQSCMVLNRRGRPAPVVLRRAWVAGQIEMPL